METKKFSRFGPISPKTLPFPRTFRTPNLGRTSECVAYPVPDTIFCTALPHFLPIFDSFPPFLKVGSQI